MHEIEGKVVYVLSRKDSEKFCWHKPWAAISITSEKSFGWPTLQEENRVNVLQIAFPDWELVRHDMSLMRKDQLAAEGERKLFNFSEDQASEILDFVDEVWPNIDALMVHCMAGLSRSPAVAAAIKTIKDGECKEFFEGGQYMPNHLVFDIILKVAKER